MSIHDDKPCDVWWHAVMIDNGIVTARNLITDCKTIEQALARLDALIESAKDKKAA